MKSHKFGWPYFLILLGFTITIANSCKKEQLPVLTTTEVSEIKEKSFTSGGNVISDGGSPVTTRGICWSTVSNPVFVYNHATADAGIGSFACNITGLTPNTKYYVRAYATNSIGTEYGNEISFETKKPLVITTIAVSSITHTTASSGGNFTNDIESVITVRGVCWTITGVPTIINWKTIDGSGTGNFISNISGLRPNTTYSLRAYATYDEGTVYGETVHFTTPKYEIIFNPDLSYETLADVDGNVYKTIKIGNQVWMAENLKTTHYADGTPIPFVETQVAWDALTHINKAYCLYHDDIKYKDYYGLLYTWGATMNGNESSDMNPSGVQGVCPTNWHLPSKTEWSELSINLGGSSIAGSKLKEIGTTYWSSPNTGATNESGFSAIPSGSRSYYGNFSSNDASSYWWSSSEPIGSNGLGYAYYMSVFYDNTSFIRSHIYKETGFTVRCIKNY